MCELQHTANGGDGRAHGGACVAGSGSAAVGGGIFEARVLLLNIDAGSLKRVAGIARREVQRATAGASTSTAPAARSGGVWIGVVQALAACGECCVPVGLVKLALEVGQFPLVIRSNHFINLS